MKNPMKYLLIAAATILGILIVAIVVFPIYVIIVSSLSPYVSFFTPFQPFPNPLTFQVYSKVLFDPTTVHFFQRLGNSLFVALLSLTLTLALVIPSSYALSRFRFAGRGTLLYGYFAFNQFAGGMGLSGLIALFAILNYLNLLDSLAALAIIYTAAGIPFNTWLLKTYFDTIPKDLDEAALVDGASYFDVILRVLLPVAAPGIATVAIFSFMGSWGEFIMANTLLLSSSNYTFPVQLYILLGSPSTNWNLFAAMSILYALPVVIMYMFAQKYLQSGLALGGVKG
jgi:arabinogalactan oligomer/maltooligosaccharide transport system permease protein